MTFEKTPGMVAAEQLVRTYWDELGRIEGITPSDSMRVRLFNLVASAIDGAGSGKTESLAAFLSDGSLVITAPHSSGAGTTVAMVPKPAPAAPTQTRAKNTPKKRGRPPKAAANAEATAH